MLGVVSKMALNLNLHPLSCRAHFWIVVTRLLHHRVDASVVVIRVMVKENQVLGTALHHDIDGFSPMAVPPAASASLVFLREILRVVHQNISASGQLADVLIEQGVPWFIVSCVDEHPLLGLEAVPHAPLRMVEPRGFERHLLQAHLAFFNLIEIALCLHLGGVNRKIWGGHLLLNHSLQAACPIRCVEQKTTLSLIIERPEERNTLDVIPMKMRNEDVRQDRTAVELAL